MKIHTKQKRRMGVGTHLPRDVNNITNKKPFKKFKTEDAAKKWAESKKAKSFDITKCKSGVKIRIK
ncbi:MAG: hypothetical protein PHT54_01510 [Candidatus Nanoarchaeia archaeon]|nr:hypothetical protein [Candidatus Nanoarchaeia archaeon]